MPLTLTYQFHDLPLRHPFTISRYTVTVQQTVIAIVSDGEISGYGEATANPYYHSTRERIGAALDGLKPLFQSIGFPHPQDLWPQMHALIPDDYFALCAADVAYWDYYSRKRNVPLRKLLSDDDTSLPMTSYTIGLASFLQL